ncbi:peptide ABC transporter substrate-binding protein [Altererythrobacter xixiisoli]|uniref:Peptide ABC transporter substrate-binding protein n=1 Tax=Croceibacterium xixiisoli TaxID=1476466 RepID=A0A6I4TWD6_9SPHN|nr:ABC transporter substrate-binding protein [Croceibacterium xixiisoli]MXP00163.1 peptide ABC transporter substrate-binding protein [Croceibacterium xixiisoli]
MLRPGLSRPTALVSLLLALAACGRSDSGALPVDFIDTQDNLFSKGGDISAGARHVRAATGAGLVALDAQGEVVPALAERWIVTDDGRSFIFRLREGNWGDASPLTAESVRTELRRAIRDVRGTALAIDLRPVEDIRAMAGRVVEIRLSSPVPMLLQLLAQPELALQRGKTGIGPMMAERGTAATRFEFKPPVERGIAEEEDWQEYVRPIVLRAATAEQAVKSFNDGASDVVLGGMIGSLPRVDVGPLSRGTVRVDPAMGLFGMRVREPGGFLADAAEREALAMAIDRPALIAPFNIGGWVPTTRVVAPGLADDPGLIAERWGEDAIADRRLVAARRVAAWRNANGVEGPVQLTLAIDRDLGHDQLFHQLAGQMVRIGVVLQRVDDPAKADLVLVDRVARYADAAWFLNQFNCSLRRGACSPQTDEIMARAMTADNLQQRATLLAEAEAALTISNVYIPFGSPLRWSLVRGRINGFSPNIWAFHPLPPMAERPR